MPEFRPRLQPFTIEEFKAIFSKTPRLTVEILLVVNDGLVLIKRQESSWNGQWHVAGGTVFYREKISDAIERIGFEELGIAIKPLKMFKAVEYWDEAVERGFGFSVGLAHLCQPIEPVTPEVILAWKTKHIEVFQSIPINTIREQQPMIAEAFELIK